MGLARRVPLLAMGLLAASGLSGSAQAQDPSFDAPRASLAARVSRALDARVDQLLGDPDASRAWIHEAIAPQSYRGVLQGALGTFLTGSGNDVDQALLLGHMLDRSMVRHRLASCAASPAPQAQARLPSTTASGERLARAIAGALADPGLRDAALSLPDLRAAMQADADEAAARLAHVLDDHAVDIPGPSTPTAAPDRHVWVQVAAGAGWRDLDPTTPTGEPGCTPDETSAEIPDEQVHQLRIDLELELRRGDEVRTTTPLSTQLSVPLAALTPITFMFGSPDALGPRMGEILEGRARYQPTLIVGDDLITGTSFELRAPGDGATGTLFGPEDETGEVPTGAWLRFTLTAPDGSETRLSSEVFDRIGVAARDAGLASSTPLEDLELVDGDYAAIDTLWQVALMTGPVVVPSAATDLSLTLADGSQTTAPIDAALRLYPSLVRDLGGDPSGITLLLAGFVPDGSTDGGAMGSRLVLDALQVAGQRPIDRTSAARDAQAVVGAERALLTLLGAEPEHAGDAGSVFEAADAGSVPWMVLRPGDTADINGASADANARIARQLAAGNHVITPTRVPDQTSALGTAWWVLDPRTGVIRDEHQSGRHMAAVDYANQNREVVGRAERFRRFACRATRPLMFAATLWWFGSGFDPAAGELLDEVATAAETAEANRRRGEEARGAACSGTGG